MADNEERLYNLLPSIYRIRDAGQGEALRALLGVMEEEMKALEADVDSLYDNWFIETCEEWAVPYIGDLLGIRGMQNSIPGAFSLRPYVADTISNRRGKGTITVVDRVSGEAAGWPARAVEFFKLIATTQSLNHLRIENKATADLRSPGRLELINGPFEDAAHTIDVRPMDGINGKYGIPNVGIYLWPLQCYTIKNACPRRAGAYYTFDVLGGRRQLYNPPRTKEDGRITEEVNAPVKLRRYPLYDELESLRAAIAGDLEHAGTYFDDEYAFEVTVNKRQVPAEEILICDLGEAFLNGWRPPKQKRYTVTTPDGLAISIDMPVTAAVDPVNGLLVFSEDQDDVRVGYSYAFGGDVGGGPYDRRDSIILDAGSIAWQAGVSKDLDPEPGAIYGSLTEAIRQWNSDASPRTGLIVIMDNCTYDESLTGEDAISIPEGSRLFIVAADWPDAQGEGGVKERRVGAYAMAYRRPHLKGDIEVRGTAPGMSEVPGELTLNGLLIEGGLKCPDGNLGAISLAHCTLVPKMGGVTVDPAVGTDPRRSLLSLSLDHVICGPIIAGEPEDSRLGAITIADSIVDGLRSTAIKARGAAADVERSTVFGGSRVGSIKASNSIFTGSVRVRRQQEGCVRYCYLPLTHGTVLRRYRCQPDLALASGGIKATACSGLQVPERRRMILKRAVPVFHSCSYGDPGYAMLAEACAGEILTGADDGAEMGAFNVLKRPQREANLRAALDEYLRFGLDAGPYYVYR